MLLSSFFKGLERSNGRQLRSRCTRRSKSEPPKTEVNWTWQACAVRRKLLLVEGLIRGLFVFQWRISSRGIERIDCVLGEIVRGGRGQRDGGVRDVRDGRGDEKTRGT